MISQITNTSHNTNVASKSTSNACVNYEGYDGIYTTTDTYTNPTTKNTSFHHRQGKKSNNRTNTNTNTYTLASSISNTSTRVETQASTYSNHIPTKVYCSGSVQNIRPFVLKCLS